MSNKPVRIPNADEMRPITLGHYTLTAIDVVVKGHPSFAEHEQVGAFIKGAHRRSGWWLAAWLRYGEGRHDWTDRLSQAVDATGLTEKTLKNVRAIGAIEPSRRRDDVDFSVHAAVAALDPEDQSAWLAKAAESGWGERDLRLAIKASHRRKIIEGQAVLAGMYRVLLADPPWQYGNRPPSGSGAVEHYPTLSIEDLCKLPVAAHALPDSVLFLWVTCPILLQDPGPRDVGRAWGFEYKQNYVWDKVDGTFSHYTGGNHEILTIWTRGSCLPDVPHDLPDSVQVVNKSRVHSAKPPEFRELIEKHWTRGPYLELFARERTPGWDVFGNDAKLWAQEAAIA